MTQASELNDVRAPTLDDKRVLVVGVGGLGSPALPLLAGAGVGRLTLLDDDVVELSNLHRQPLFEERDVGTAKVVAAARTLHARWPRLEVAPRQERLCPDTALDWVRRHDLVLEGADNFATKFLAADAARLAQVPIAQAGAVRWSGWALASAGEAGPCLRCVFEDIPRGQPETCAIAGVIGPVVSALSAIQTALALELLAGRSRASGVLFSYDALRGKLRKRRVTPRPGCPLCERRFRDLAEERYLGPYPA